ncbi:MAG: hypothetical protein GX595_10660 [Lentisphaerae bacterium]|nr:hypothetical protein [Lentisphaerota bacterium]
MRMWPHSRVLTILAAGLAAAVGVHAETLLPLPNAGFEEGLAGWADSSKAPMGTVTPEAAQSGEAGLRIVDADNRAGSALRSGRVPVRPGFSYALRFWGRTLSGSGMAVYLEFYDADGRLLTTHAAGREIAFSLPARRDWAAYTLVGTAPEGSAQAGVWLHSINAAVVTADLDTLSLSELTQEEALVVKTSVQTPPPDVQTPDPARVAALAALLTPTPQGLGEPIQRRERWEALAALPSASAILRRAAATLETAPPELPDDLYLDFSRTGNRDRFQRPYGERTRRLNALVLAECLEDEGRFLAGIEREIMALCDERSWTMPAHDAKLTNFEGTHLTIDLGSSARAHLLATCDWLLGDRLNASCRARLRAEVDRRVLSVYLAAVRAGETRGNWWIRGTSNWNAVCLANVVGTALALVEEVAVRAECLAAMEISNPFFLSGFSEDGYCSEGLGYWDYGFGHYLMLGDMVLKATGGRLDILGDDAKLLRIGAYPIVLHLQPGLAPAFADCGINPRPSNASMALVHRHLPEALPTPWPCDPLAGGVVHVGLFGFEEDTFAVAAAEAVFPELPMRTWFDQAGILVSRSAPNAAVPLAAAFKGGHNAEHHNHNDVGSYVVGVAGHAYVLDPGGEVYTRRTFSAQRYVSPVLNSHGHAVPVVAGQLQRTGASARGRVLASEFSDDVDRLVLDLASCYEVKDLEVLERTFEFRRAEGAIVVEDRVRFASPQSFATALITLDRTHWRAPDRLVIYDHRGALEVAIAVEGGAWTGAIEDIDNPGRPSPRRLGVALDEPVREARVRLTLRPVEAAADLPGIYREPALNEAFHPVLEKAITVQGEAFTGQAGGEVAIVDKPAAVDGKAFRLWDRAGHRLEWTFAVPADGRYAVRLRACHDFPGLVTRQVLLDGQPVGDPAASCPFPNTGGWSNDRDDWREVTLVQEGRPVVLDLRAGQHVLGLVADRPGGLNVDWISLVPLR